VWRACRTGPCCGGCRSTGRAPAGRGGPRRAAARAPGEDIPDGHVFSPGPRAQRRRPDQVIYCQHRHDRARRTLCGIDEQVAKARWCQFNEVSAIGPSAVIPVKLVS
jgi:hypothetical protein